jgi:hypothetical protein
MQELTADWKPAGELLQQLLNVIEAAGKEKNQERTVVQSQLLPISEMRKSSERKPVGRAHGDPPLCDICSISAASPAACCLADRKLFI